MQLLDEIPMHWLVTFTSYCLWTRGAGFSRFGTLLLTVVESGASGVLWFVPREAPLHEVCRGIMAVTFSACFVYIFVVSARAGQEIDTMTDVTARKDQSGKILFGRAFKVFLLALACWVVDVLYCPVLHDLPFKIPYPQLHSFWHLLSALGVYHISTIILYHRQLRSRLPSSLGWALNILPYVISPKKVL